MVENIYKYYIHNFDKLPVNNGGDALETAVCDYVAGMSDRFAFRLFKELFVPGAMK
jgi:dGTPase